MISYKKETDPIGVQNHSVFQNAEEVNGFFFKSKWWF
jgi:hypothetical protein